MYGDGYFGRRCFSACMAADASRDLFHRYGRARAHEAVITHFHKSGGQHMLEKTAHKFHYLKGFGAPPVAARFLVFEKNLPVFDFNNAVVRKGHFEDVGCQIFNALRTGANGLTVDHPGLLPDIRADTGSKPALFHLIEKFGFEDFGHDPYGQVKVLAQRVPASIGPGERAAGHDVVNMGMVGHRSAPGVQHAEKAGKIGADELLVARQLLQSLRGCREHRRVAPPRMAADKSADIFGDRESDHELVHGKLLMDAP